MNLADQLMSASNQAVRIQLAQDASGDFYPAAKETTMTTCDLAKHPVMPIQTPEHEPRREA